MKLYCILLLLYAISNHGNCAKILGVFSMASHSHFTLGEVLMKELAARGHEVTFISAYPQKVPIKNLKDISVADIVGDVTAKKKDLYDMHYYHFLKKTKFVLDLGLLYTGKLFKSPSFKNFLKSKDTFDVIIIENFVNEALIGLGHHFNAPVILLTPGPVTFLNEFVVGNPPATTYVPNVASNFAPEMSVWERLANLYYNAAGSLLVHLYGIRNQNKILKDALPDSPDLQELMYNVSLILSCSHVSLNTPAPYLPSIKEIGGYHVRKPKPLPKDLQVYLDSAKDGVVIFSLGSNIKSADLPEKTKGAILRSFSKIKQKVLWKFEEDLPNKPENVRILQWLPQNDVFAHPNVKLFITHGGFLSLIEAVYQGVPILGIPVFWDQQLNIEAAVQNGFALSVPFRDVSEFTFFSALEEMLGNPKYTKNVKRRSAVLHDQPISPMDNAVFWIEHIIRHKGGEHFQSPALKLKWYQRSMLDIIVILTVITIVLYIIFYEIIKHILGLFFNKKTDAQKSKKNR